MTSFHLTPRARTDLEAIWEYIADDNLEAADRVLDGLQSACSTFWPKSTHWPPARRFDYKTGSILVGKTVPPGTRPVEIVAVIHSARDLAAILQDIKI